MHVSLLTLFLGGQGKSWWLYWKMHIYHPQITRILFKQSIVQEKTSGLLQIQLVDKKGLQCRAVEIHRLSSIMNIAAVSRSITAAKAP